MALSIVSTGTTDETATNVPTSDTLTPGLPGTRSNGDILLCFTTCRSATASVSVSTSGWTEILNAAGTVGKIALFACKVDGSESAAECAWTGLTSGTSGSPAAARIACVRGGFAGAGSAGADRLCGRGA